MQTFNFSLPSVFGNNSTKMKSVIVLAVVCMVAKLSQAAVLNEACSKSADCTVTNSKCYKEYMDCGKGECVCKDGYREQNSACKLVAKRDETCSSDILCETGFTCLSTTNKCGCTTSETYSTKLGTCLTTASMKLIGEECASDSECHNAISDSVECIANSGTTTPKYCRCKSGYRTDMYTCREPYYGETCTAAVGCSSIIGLIDSSHKDEICGTTSLKCECASTEEKITTKRNSKTYNLCYTKLPSGTALKDAKTACTESNQCKSHFCHQCPGDSSSICVRLPSSAKKISAFGVLTFLSLAVMFM